MVRDAFFFSFSFCNLGMRNTWVQVTKSQLLPDPKKLGSLHLQHNPLFLWTAGPPIPIHQSHRQRTLPQIPHQLQDCPLALLLEGPPEARPGTEFIAHAWLKPIVFQEPEGMGQRLARLKTLGPGAMSSKIQGRSNPNSHSMSGLPFWMLLSLEPALRFVLWNYYKLTYSYTWN